MVVLVGGDWRRWLVGLTVAWVLRRLRPPEPAGSGPTFGPTIFALGTLVYLGVVLVTIVRGRSLRISS